MSDLAAFLRARLDEDAAGAWAVHDVSKCDALLYEDDMADAARRHPDCDCGYPARVLREVEAKRKILTEYQRVLGDAESIGGPSRRPRLYGQHDGLVYAVKTLVDVYRDHPDYDPSWAAT